MNEQALPPDPLDRGQAILNLVHRIGDTGIDSRVTFIYVFDAGTGYGIAALFTRGFATCRKILSQRAMAFRQERPSRGALLRLLIHLSRGEQSFYNIGQDSMITCPKRALPPTETGEPP